MGSNYKYDKKILIINVLNHWHLNGQPRRLATLKFNYLILIYIYAFKFKPFFAAPYLLRSVSLIIYLTKIGLNNKLIFGTYFKIRLGLINV